AAPLLYVLPLSGMLASLMVMERARRRLSTSRFPGLILDPIIEAFARVGSLIPGRRRAVDAAGGRR
ncbi:MAG: hypothetical protein WC829_17210, partial [Hyphomicrobium sp.]